jgi:hypothetical protein
MIKIFLFFSKEVFMERVYPINVESIEWPTYQMYQSLFYGVCSQLDSRVNTGILHPAIANIKPVTGRIDVVSAVIDPTRIVASDDVIRWGRSHSLRPLFPWEYHMFIAHYFEKMRDVRTVCLGFQYRKRGSVFFSRTKYFVPHAYQIGQDLCLDSAEYEHLWLNGTHFLFTSY